MHPEDRCLFRMKWQGNLFLDTALPFGLRSAPKIFSAVADGLLWAMACNGIQEGIHYLDDFLLAGKADTLECASALDTAFRTCREVGFPVAMNKVEGASTNLTFLGILFDTAAGQLHLPQDKLGKILHELERWSQRKVCTKRELLSIIGLLQHIASIVKPGRIFLRHLINLSKIPRQLHHRVCLNKGVSSDLLWWSMFIKHWNGCSVLPNPSQKFSLHSDASGSWGCGRIGKKIGFNISGQKVSSYQEIATKELLPIVWAACVWSRFCFSAHITCFCDNMAVVHMLNNCSAKDDCLMHLMRCLHFVSAHYHFSISAVHIAGKTNVAADALSRDSRDSFLLLSPQACKTPTVIPEAIFCHCLMSETYRDMVEWTAVTNGSILVPLTEAEQWCCYCN